MRRTAMLKKLVAGVNAAVKPLTPGATLKPWGVSAAIEVPGYRYVSYSPPMRENTEVLQGTVTGWIRAPHDEEEVISAIVAELHSDRWRTYEPVAPHSDEPPITWRCQFGGVRVDRDEEPGVIRFDLDFEMEALREMAGRY